MESMKKDPNQPPTPSDAFRALPSAARARRLRPLRDFVSDLRVGLRITKRYPTVGQQGTASRDVSDSESHRPHPQVPGMISILDGRDVRHGRVHARGRSWAVREAVPDELVIRPGDVLFRRSLHPGQDGTVLVAAVVETEGFAAVGPDLLRLRWRNDVPDEARELLVAWLVSEAAVRSLRAHGLQPEEWITAAVLGAVEVPDPDPEVITALASLSRIEAWYRDRAEAVKVARHEVFSANRYAEAIPLLLSTQRSEGERVTAAEDSQQFGYRVRNGFPHPLSLRRESLQVLPPGQDRLDKTLECAEYLVHYLAVCGLVQLGSVRAKDAFPSRHLRSMSRGNRLRFSWGTSWNVFAEAASLSRNLDNPLLSPFPGLCLEPGTAADSAASAEAELRRQRNRQSHLVRGPELEVEGLSSRLGEQLDQILRSVTFIADVPLVHVRDVALDEVTGERRVVFEFIRGASPAFASEERIAKRELARGSLGFLGRDGRFHSASPWLLLRTCTICMRGEVFLFSRFEAGVATYVAMQSGHVWSSDLTNERFRKLLAAADAGLG